MAEPVKLKTEKKHAAPTGCQEGHHTYIVTNWSIKPNQQKAHHMRCQHCLMPLDLAEIEAADWNKANGIG